MFALGRLLVTCLSQRLMNAVNCEACELLWHCIWLPMSLAAASLADAPNQGCTSGTPRTTF